MPDKKKSKLYKLKRMFSRLLKDKKDEREILEIDENAECLVELEEISEE